MIGESHVGVLTLDLDRMQSSLSKIFDYFNDIIVEPHKQHMRTETNWNENVNECKLRVISFYDNILKNNNSRKVFILIYSVYKLMSDEN